MPRPRATNNAYFYKAERRRLEFLRARRAALSLAIRHLKDYRRLRAKRLAAGLLKIA